MTNLTKFQDTGLEKTDKNGYLVKHWCRKDTSSVYNAHCFLCCKTFKVNNTGLLQVLNHSLGQKHAETAKASFENQQRHFAI